jgi:hypothetical protein
LHGQVAEVGLEEDRGGEARGLALDHVDEALDGVGQQLVAGDGFVNVPPGALHRQLAAKRGCVAGVI